MKLRRLDGKGPNRSVGLPEAALASDPGTAAEWKLRAASGEAVSIYVLSLQRNDQAGMGVEGLHLYRQFRTPMKCPATAAAAWSMRDNASVPG